MSDDNNFWISVSCSIAVLAAASLCERIEPNKGVDWRIHAAYWAVAICSVAFLPLGIASYIFTSLTVTLVGAVYPIYRATKAVCTPEEHDDKEWLQVPYALVSLYVEIPHFIRLTISAAPFHSYSFGCWVECCSS